AVPVVSVAHIALDPVQQRVHPVELEDAFLGLADGMRLLPFRADLEAAPLRPPQRLERLGHVLGRLGPVERGKNIGHRYHHGVGEKSVAALRSMTRPAANNVSSSNGRPMICRPSGRPRASLPAGTAIPGRPAMFTVTVKMSLRY